MVFLGGVHGFFGGHAWFFLEGACMIFWGGMRGFFRFSSGQGACMVFWGEMHVFFWFTSGRAVRILLDMHIYVYDIYIYICVFNIYEKDRDEHCYLIFSNLEEYIICITWQALSSIVP